MCTHKKIPCAMNVERSIITTREIALMIPPNFNFLGKPLLGEKYVEGKKKEKERKNNAKFSGHYVCPRTETVREHALRSHQNYAMAQ